MDEIVVYDCIITYIHIIIYIYIIMCIYAIFQFKTVVKLKYGCVKPLDYNNFRRLEKTPSKIGLYYFR
jgi:hypothetical protein